MSKRQRMHFKASYIVFSVCLNWHLTLLWFPDGLYKICPVFIQGIGLWNAHSVPFQKDLIHCRWLPSVRLPRLKVNMATVLAVSPLALWTFGLWGGPASHRHAHPSAQVEWLQSEPFCGHGVVGLLLTIRWIYNLGNGLEYDRWPVSIV